MTLAVGGVAVNLCCRHHHAENCSRNLRQPITMPVRLNTNPRPHNVTIKALRSVGCAASMGKSSVCSAL